jgi:hypothetical protein
MWVTSDKTHVEHNESALTLIADVWTGTDFRRYGPLADSCAVATKGLFDHPVGTSDQPCRNFEAKLLGRLEVDD